MSVRRTSSDNKKFLFIELQNSQKASVGKRRLPLILIAVGIGEYSGEVEVINATHHGPLLGPSFNVGDPNDPELTVFIGKQLDFIQNWKPEISKTSGVPFHGFKIT